MKIIVLVKEVPDTWGERRLDLQTGTVDRDAGDRVLDEINERAIDFAVNLTRNGLTDEVVLLSMGPSSVAKALRQGLALGASRGIHVMDEQLPGADLTLSAEVLAAAIIREGFDLVIAGASSTDGSTGVLPAMVAEHLGVPQLSALDSVQVSSHTVVGSCLTPQGVAQISARLPAVVSVTESLPEAKMPSFKMVAAAKKKTVETVTLADLAIDAQAEVPRAIMIQAAERPARSGGIKLIDQDDAAQQLASFLLSNKLV